MLPNIEGVQLDLAEVRFHGPATLRSKIDAMRNYICPE